MCLNSVFLVARCPLLGDMDRFLFLLSSETSEMASFLVAVFLEPELKSDGLEVIEASDSA